MDAEDLWQIKGRLPGAGVLPNFEIPVGPVPDGSQEQEATENDVGGGNALEAPEAGVYPRLAGDAPAAPAAGDPQASHERHYEHALTPHGVQDSIRRVKDGELIEGHRTGPAGNQGGVHEVHRQKAARVVDDDRMHPVPGQSHWIRCGETRQELRRSCEVR